MTKKLNKEEERIQKKIESDAKKKFSMYTIQLFDLNKSIKSNERVPATIYRITEEIDFVLKHEKETLFNKKRINASLLNKFLLNGDFNSILGYPGIKIFRDELLVHISEQLDSTSEKIEINKDFMTDLVFRSGIIYEYINANEVQKDLFDNYDFRSIQRLVLTRAEGITFDLLTQEFLGATNKKLLKTVTKQEIELLQNGVEATVKTLHIELTDFLNSEKNIKPNSLRTLGRAS